MSVPEYEYDIWLMEGMDKVGLNKLEKLGWELCWVSAAGKGYFKREVSIDAIVTVLDTFKSF